MSEFVTKDSGQRQEFASGMVRDVQEGKPRYDLIPLAPLKRLAELYSRGAEKYGDRNWQKADSTDELDRMKASAFRHFMQWLNGEDDEDHAIGAVWNIFAALWLEEKLGQQASMHEPLLDQVARLAEFIMDRFPEAIQGEGAIDTAIAILSVRQNG